MRELASVLVSNGSCTKAFECLDELSAPPLGNSVAGECDQTGAAEYHHLRIKSLDFSAKTSDRSVNAHPTEYHGAMPSKCLSEECTLHRGAEKGSKTRDEMHET